MHTHAEHRSLGKSFFDIFHDVTLTPLGVKFHSLTEAIDRTTPTGRAMWHMIGVLAELERSLILDRPQAGMKEARCRGVKFGRKKKLSPAQIGKARKLIDAGERVEDVAALWNVGRTTLYRALVG